MDYLDFNLEIGQGGPETYPVSVDSPGGQAEQEMHFPFGDSELENKLLALENALLRSGGSHRGISPQEQTVRDFGESLFKAILTGDVKTRYEVSLREAGGRTRACASNCASSRLSWHYYRGSFSTTRTV